MAERLDVDFRFRAFDPEKPRKSKPDSWQGNGWNDLHYESFLEMEEVIAKAHAELVAIAKAAHASGRVGKGGAKK